MLWLAARRSGHAAVNALAWPGLGVLIVCLMLSYSRGALLAAGIGLAIWFAVVPLRLRAATALGLVLLLTVPILAWAFAQDGLTVDQPPLVLREDTGYELGALLLLLLVALAVAGSLIGFLSSVRPPSAYQRRRASRILIGTLAVVPAVGILMLANAPGGINGQVSSAWNQAVDPAVPDAAEHPGRLHRDLIWSAPLLARGDEDPRAGPMAGDRRRRVRDAAAALSVEDQRTVRHAHGYVVQTLADLGWVGLGALPARDVRLAVRGRTGRRCAPARPRPPMGRRARRVATLAVVALIFGIHSTIDWTWFVPGNVVPARAVRRLGRLAPAAARAVRRRTRAIAAANRPSPGDRRGARDRHRV